MRTVEHEQVSIQPRRESYDLRSMSIGDSFWVPMAKAASARTTAYGFAARNPTYKFRSVKEPKDGQPGVRIERIAIIDTDGM